MTMADDLYERGMTVRKAVLGEAHVARASANATPFDRDFQDFITQYAWGGVWTRPGLERKTRSLLTIAMLAALGRTDELKLHIRATRNTGATREEVKEEFKESEGSPETRGRIREVQRALAKGRMLQDVPKADVIITNPTHYAVALRYDEKKMHAPLVVAKGTDLLAAKIREIAAEHGVPVVEAPPLARALHKSVEIGREVPAALYVAVAQVLTYVYQLKAARERGATPPPPPTIQ